MHFQTTRLPLYTNVQYRAHNELDWELDEILTKMDLLMPQIRDQQVHQMLTKPRAVCIIK